MPAGRERTRTRVRVWPWVTVLIVAALAVGAWFAGEWLARQLVADRIRGAIVAELDLPDSQVVDVEVAGAVIPQLIGGRLDDVTVASDDVVIGSFGGDVRVRALGVPIRGDAPAGGGTATVRVDEAQLRTLLGTVDGFPSDAVGIDDPNVTASMAIDVVGASVDVGVALTPSVSAGDLVLSPASVSLGGAEVTAQALRDRFGAVVDPVLKDWPVCVASQLPAGISLTGATVSGDTLRAEFDIDGAIFVDPALREAGRCT